MDKRYDPYTYPSGGDPEDLARWQTLHDAARNPEFIPVTDPETGEVLRHADGTPVMFPKPLEQRMAPYMDASRIWRLRLGAAGAIGVVLILLMVALRDTGEWIVERILAPAFGVALLGGAAFLIIRHGWSIVRFVFYDVWRRPDTWR
ncbi:hypothetical protein [Nonomuraea typhae]|uniref:hypothetical protein n=1 Tax=Nonomuraea typhae TaxID=2603600 RepID=UPI0012FC7A8A|nr:hypothetical protein [Nonomuraea typhae]